MNKMNTVHLPVARTSKELRREMLRANRFLGRHQAWWGLVLTPVVLFVFALLTVGGWNWWWPFAAFIVAWGTVELCFLPRRLAIQRLAAIESRAEVVRLAWLHGVALRDVIRERHRTGH
ncbi:hypothetical protein [Billgrantia bachuensis]|uniref:Uncharacterized protein n=1 Tax=Billgrantia bachuensis TaxID=2717286 RepID=A0ABX0PMV4_9GAMM|nr:hypothetical protein [Halomonas bachuensis]NIC04391.1 hypothetical protein [Halomonas bachuensis]